MVSDDYYARWEGKTERITFKLEPSLKKKFKNSNPNYVKMSEKIRRLVLKDLRERGYDVSMYD